MNTSEWQVKIVTDYSTFRERIYIFRRYNGKIQYVDFPENTPIKTVDEGDEVAGLHIPPEMLQALVNAVHKDYKPSEQRFVDGKLTATERHLEDLQKLLKLRK